MYGAKEEGFSGCGPGAEGEEQPGGNACVEVGRGFFLREEPSTSSPGSSSSIWVHCSRGIETGACSGLRVEGCMVGGMKGWVARWVENGKGKFGAAADGRVFVFY